MADGFIEDESDVPVEHISESDLSIRELMTLEKGVLQSLLRFKLEYEHLEEDLERLGTAELEDDELERFRNVEAAWEDIEEHYWSDRGWQIGYLLQDLAEGGEDYYDTILDRLEEQVEETNSLHSEIRRYPGTWGVEADIDYERLTAEVEQIIEEKMPETALTAAQVREIDEHIGEIMQQVDEGNIDEVRTRIEQIGKTIESVTERVDQSESDLGKFEELFHSATDRWLYELEYVADELENSNRLTEYIQERVEEYHRILAPYTERTEREQRISRELEDWAEYEEMMEGE